MGRRCVFLAPPSVSSGETVVRYRSVPLASRIQGHVGQAWHRVRDLTGAPVTLRVLVNGTQVGKLVHDNEPGWESFDFPLGALAGTHGTVEFRSSAPNNRDRFFCFEADSR